MLYLTLNFRISIMTSSYSLLSNAILNLIALLLKGFSFSVSRCVGRVPSRRTSMMKVLCYLLLLPTACHVVAIESFAFRKHMCVGASWTSFTHAPVNSLLVIFVHYSNLSTVFHFPIEPCCWRARAPTGNLNLTSYKKLTRTKTIQST